MNKYLEAIGEPEENKYLTAFMSIPEEKPSKNILSDIGSAMAMESQYSGAPGRVALATISSLKTFIPSGIAGASGFIQSKGKTFDEKLSDAERARSLVADTIPQALLKTPEEQRAAEVAGYIFKPIEWVGEAAEKLAKYLNLKYIPGDTFSPAGSPQGLDVKDAVSLDFAPTIAKIAGEFAAISLIPTAAKKTQSLAKTAGAINRFAKAADIKKSIAFKTVVQQAHREAKTMEETANSRALTHNMRALEDVEPESKIGQPLIMPKDYTGEKSPIPERLKTTVLEGETPLPGKEVPLRPDQRAALAQKSWLAEESNIPIRELTPEQIAQRNMVRGNEQGLSAAEKQRNIQAELNKKLTGNKYLDRLASEISLETPSPVPFAGAQKTPRQVPEVKSLVEDVKVPPVADLQKTPTQIGEVPAGKTEGNPLRERIMGMEGTADQKLNALNDHQNKYKLTKEATDNVESIHKELLSQREIERAAESTPSTIVKQSSSDAPRTIIPDKEGLGQAGTPRKVSEIWKDMKTVMGDTERGSVSNKPLTENQIAAIERISEDARRAKTDISEYMKKHGAKPEAIAKVLANKELYYSMQKQKEGVAQTAKEPVIKDSKKVINHYSQPKGRIVKDTLTNLDNAFGVVSTRLGNVAIELKDRVKMNAAEKTIRTKNTVDEVTPFYKKFDKLSEKEQLEIHLLLDNGQYKSELREQGLKLLKEKGMLAEFLKADVATYKKLHREFIESGGKSNEVSKNYISRHVKDYPGLRESLGKENIGKIDEAFIKEAQKKGVTVEELGDEAKGAIIDSMMRGWSKNKIFLFDPFEVKTGIGKSRSLNILTTEQLSKYYPLHESMLKYAENMNAAIANNNLFKKNRTIGKAVREQWLEDIDVPDKARTNDSIGDIILDLKNKGKFSKDPGKAMEQEAEVKHVLTSYMMPKSQGKFVTGLKNLTYNALLGNIEVAMTQFQDIPITISRHGVRNTIQGFGRMFTEKAQKLADVGLDNFKADLERNTKMGKATKINMAALSLTDMFGKGLNMNANLVKTQRALKNPKYKPEIETEINRLFGEDAAQVKQDLLNNKKTFATNSFVHYNLAKHHPISTAEVPTGYLNSDKGRLLYMLHTYQIKQLDIYRNDVLNEIKSGNIKKGAYNFASLTSWLLAGGVSVNAAKDFIFKGETKSLDEYLINAAWQLTLASRYLVDKGFREGVGSFLWEGVAPGTVSIANDISKDLKDVIEGNDGKSLRSTKFIPLVGRPYYDRFGRGSE